MILRPARPGLRVLMPERGNLPLPVEGLEIREPLSSYWLRRLRDGDVVKGPASSASAPAKAAPKTRPTERE